MRGMTGMTAYRNLGEVITSLAEGLRPPQRLQPSEALAQHLRLDNPGAYVGPWLNEKVPYMVEPMNVLTDRNYTASIFVGPAQCAKTESLILGPIVYGAHCNPMDMLIYQTSMNSASDFSRRRIDRLLRKNPKLTELLLGGTSSDTIFTKVFRSGMMVTMSWPTINELSGRPVPWVFLTDYDRMPQDVDGEGNPFDLATKRTTTFGRLGKTVCESSPGFPQRDPQWIASTAHEAPPADGILALYNRGDRRRWYWQCEACGHWFEGEYALLTFPPDANPVQAGEMATMECPHCHHQHKAARKFDLNRNGRWLRDGERFTLRGEIDGEPIRSNIASFWLKGVAAAFASWGTLVQKMLQAEAEYRRTNSQDALKSVTNTDLGLPYIYRTNGKERSAEAYRAQAVPARRGAVPDGVRSLFATVDVQKTRFAVLVIGMRPEGLAVVDRFDITKSLRLDGDGDRMPVEPHAYLEDWDLIDLEVKQRTYEVPGFGTMTPRDVFCDSAGREGVTSMAYDYWRQVRTWFHLTKGNPRADAPRSLLTFPDGERKDRHAKARGEIPVLLLNSNVLKDQLDGMLQRGAVEFPEWLDLEFYRQLCAEVRTAKGWENPRSARNEPWDLLYMALGAMHHKKWDRISWDDPPSWAAEWERNTAIEGKVKPVEQVSQGWGDFARKLC